MDIIKHRWRNVRNLAKFQRSSTNELGHPVRNSYRETVPMKSTSSRATAETRRSSEGPRHAGKTDGAMSSPAGPVDWRMPCGLGLAEFALRGGFVAPVLMKRGAPRIGERP